MPRPDLRTIVKRLVLSDLDVTTDQICMLLKRYHGRLSTITVSGIRRDFLHDLRVLDQEVLLDLSSFPPGKYAHVRVRRRRSFCADTRQQKSNISTRQMPTHTRKEPDNSIDWRQVYSHRRIKPKRTPKHFK